MLARLQEGFAARTDISIGVVLDAVPNGDNACSRLVSDVRACTACERMSHVLGAANGPIDARALFVADAAGRRSAAVTVVPSMHDESGRHFAAFLALAGLSRDGVFITNAVLCNPTDAVGRNRTPSSGEIARCRPFLARTLALIDAPVVVALGRVALGMQLGGAA